MAFNLFARIQAKWRGILVYTLLQALTHSVTRVIFYESLDPRLKIYANVASVVTTLYCFINTSLLVLRDRDGDEDWPPLWS